MTIIKDFENQNGVEKPTDAFITRSGNSIPIYEISSFHILTQFVGYAKYLNRNDGNVYLRGQSSLYNNTIIPSLLRNSKVKENRIYKSHEFIRVCIENCSDLKTMERKKLLPLLHHYGVKTVWLDVVDNIWVALWFGIHNFSAHIIDGHAHMHITENSDNEWAYILLLLSDANTEVQAGIYNGTMSVVTDLRKACPSYFLRPHAQHGLMIRERVDVPEDYSDFLIGVAKIQVKDGFDWLGRNGLLSIQSLFPPTFYDYGFRFLLENYKADLDKEIIKQYGSIQYISY